MKINVQRFEFGTNYTISKLTADNLLTQIYVLEDVVREKEGVPVAEWKIKDQTAIPKGTYKVDITYSNRFKKDLPLLLDVPGFDGIRIHPGNTDADTSGCLLPGLTWAGTDFVGQSQKAFDILFPMIEAAIDRGEEVMLTIG